MQRPSEASAWANAWRLLAVCVLTGLGSPASAQDTTTARLAEVTYISGPSYYINAGRLDGLVEGSEVTVVRADSVVAALKVQYLSSHQAVCAGITGESAVKVGDRVRFTAQRPEPSAGQANGDSGRRNQTERPSGSSGLHGRIGARYLVVNDGGTGLGYGQPSADIRLAGEDLAGGIGLTVDVRARRTTSSFSNGPDRVDSRASAYEGNIFWRVPGSPLRMAVGRQYSQSLAALNLFDGALLELTKPTWNSGVFGGTQPDPDLGFSTDVSEYGGYFGLHSRPGTSAPWAITTGIVGSYFRGKANREFAYLQAFYSGASLSVFGSQELDYYRPWKAKAGEPPLSPTSTYLTTRLRLDRGISLFAGYDTRRNVRLYRDVVDPLTNFDDAYRQGAWGGVGLNRPAWRVSADVRSSFGGPSGTATSWTGTAGLNRITVLRASVSARVTRYANPRLDGWLYGLRAGADIAGPLHLELNGGLREETEPLAFPSRRSIAWFGADADLALGRSWFMMLSASREATDHRHTDQLYGALSWRF